MTGAPSCCGCGKKVRNPTHAAIETARALNSPVVDPSMILCEACRAKATPPTPLLEDQA